MKVFYCDQCHTQIFFENNFCQSCQKNVGYIPEEQEMKTFEVTPEGWKRLDGSTKLYRPCKNYQQHQVCNWMVNIDSPSDFCESCRLTRVIPNLHEEQNITYWAQLETAKRRFLYMTQRLNIFPRRKKDDNDRKGLSFRFLVPTDKKPVLTGHANGVITLNAFEADHLYRERTRISMGEEYRTLLGHFRHESGHYYFDVLIDQSHWIDEFRTLFGDERLNYSEALKKYYDQGAHKDWQNHFISAYASSHPWEDWAETWAHYLHMISTLETAYFSGLSIKSHHQYDPALTFTECPVGSQDFKRIIQNWFALSYGLNALNRSMGLNDAYPFTLSSRVIEKLGFIHKVLLEVKEHPQDDLRFNPLH